MCISTKEAKELKEGINIDKPIHEAIQEAFKILYIKGYNPNVDVIHFSNNYETHLTVLRYVKTTSEIVENEKREINHYTLSIPDRYIPAKKETL